MQKEIIITKNIMEAFAKLSLSGVEWKILLYCMFHESFLSLNEIAYATNIHINSAWQALVVLEKRNIIVCQRKGKHKITVVTLNPDTSKWKFAKTKKTKEETILKQKKSQKIIAPKLFWEFWKVYPKKIQLVNASREWKKLNPDEELSNFIISQVGKFKTSEEWKKNNGKYVPSPHNFIGDKRWNDNLTYIRDWRET